MNEKDIKQEIRALKKLKLQCKSGTKERIALYREIKELQAKISDLSVVDIDKQKLIDTICKQDNSFNVLGIDLRKFTIEQLQFHLKKISQKSP